MPRNATRCRLPRGRRRERTGSRALQPVVMGDLPGLLPTKAGLPGGTGAPTQQGKEKCPPVRVGRAHTDSAGGEPRMALSDERTSPWSQSMLPRDRLATRKHCLGQVPTLQAGLLGTNPGAGVSAGNAVRHKTVNLLKTFLAHQFSLVFVYLMGGPRQLLFQCGPGTPQGWTAPLPRTWRRPSRGTRGDWQGGVPVWVTEKDKLTGHHLAANAHRRQALPTYAHQRGTR